MPPKTKTTPIQAVKNAIENLRSHIADLGLGDAAQHVRQAVLRLLDGGDGTSVGNPPRRRRGRGKAAKSKGAPTALPRGRAPASPAAFDKYAASRDGIRHTADPKMDDASRAHWESLGWKGGNSKVTRAFNRKPKAARKAMVAKASGRKGGKGWKPEVAAAGTEVGNA
jgi:hypothetical protein